MDIEELINLFKELISLLELKGENPFKIRAYEKATEQIKASNLSFRSLISKIDGGDNLGLGPQILRDIREINSTGSLEIHHALLEEIPKEMLELLKIRGLGPKKIIQLQKELNIKSVEEFKEHLEKGSLKRLKGFGEKTLLSLQDNLQFYLSSKGYFLIDAHENTLTKVLSLSPENLIPEGISDAKDEVFTELTLATKKSIVQKIKSTIENSDLSLVDMNLEESSLSFRLNSVPVSIRLVEDEEFHSLTKEKNREQLNPSHLKGLLHMHSTYSDGQHSIRELAEEAIKLGYSYIGITDHSQSAAYAGGLKPDEIKSQHLEIERLNNELTPFRIFKGIESDILADGALDYSDKVLSSFDFIVASVHSNFTLSESEMTKRIITAIKNPYTTILGHPTGRLLLKRPEYKVSISEILKVAKEEGVVVEINSNPKRLDLSWKEISSNKNMIPKLAITPDAHSKEQLAYVKYGIMMANKANVEKNDILNCLSQEECRNFFKHRKNNG